MLFTIDTVMKFDGMQTIRGLITVKDIPLHFTACIQKSPKRQASKARGSPWRLIV